MTRRGEITQELDRRKKRNRRRKLLAAGILLPVVGSIVTFIVWWLLHLPAKDYSLDPAAIKNAVASLSDTTRSHVLTETECNELAAVYNEAEKTCVPDTSVSVEAMDLQLLVVTADRRYRFYPRGSELVTVWIYPDKGQKIALESTDTRLLSLFARMREEAGLWEDSRL